MKPHVAILPNIGLGHLIPMLEFAKRLVVHHGIRITLLVITTNEPSTAQDQLLSSPNLPLDLHIVKLPPVDADKLGIDGKPILTQVCVTTDESLRSLKSVLLALGKPTALVLDIFDTQAFDVCNELSIPAYLFFSPAATFFAFVLYLPKLDSEVVEGEFVDLPEPIQVPGCSNPVRTEDLVDQVCDRKSEDYKWFFYHMSRLPLASGIFLNSWEDLEPISIKALKENPFFKQIPTPPVYPIGPLIKEEETLSTVGVECMEWLDKQPPDSVIFVSFGSGGTLSMEQQNELAWGLELSQQRFIWVVRQPTDATAVGAFFNAGSEVNDDPKAYLSEGFLKKTQGLGLVVSSWAPQVTILGHPSTGGFLSHCGWNSSLESIAHGVPMIAWPLYAEQAMNTTLLVEEIGVAARLKMEVGQTIYGRKEIERVVRMVMEGEEGKAIRRRVKELKESAANSHGSSFNLLSNVANQWKIDLN